MAWAGSVVQKKAQTPSKCGRMSKMKTVQGIRMLIGWTSALEVGNKSDGTGRSMNGFNGFRLGMVESGRRLTAMIERGPERDDSDESPEDDSSVVSTADFLRLGGRLSADIVDARVSTVVPLWKRVLDVSLILLSLPVLVPLMGFIAIFIKIVSPGPVFFRQERVGFQGRRFTCLKFRSMHVGAGDGDHVQHVKQLMATDGPMKKLDIKGDKRVIPGGAAIRSTGLDELPQLINVLLGEMSIVGPRPCTVYEWDEYLPSQRERFNTLPGLTGLWQVSGKNSTTFNQMVAFDIEYVRRKSFWFDLQIMFRTFPTLLGQVREAIVAKSKGTATERPAPACSQLPQVGLGTN